MKALKNPREVTPSILREMIGYDPETGALTWLVSIGRAAPGHEALKNSSKSGYRKGQVLGKTLLAHRVAWAIFYGRWPDALIDHVNGDKSDNRIENLRECTPAQNMKNVGAYATNTSGYKGVSLHKPTGKWTAFVRVNGKNKNLGLFQTKEQAFASYCNAANIFYGEFARVA